ncbi:MAG: signal recognition particle-docking protein FtsY, partial [Candidatus Aenigmarchaeota archaeon]|nr:signal recognition particle-docking protein FtsY [Candidatus Aenigmarchaeota archaeon]
DALILTKAEIYEKGGSILTAAYSIRKPILFLGVGQGYEDLQPFDPDKFVKQLLAG